MFELIGALIGGVFRLAPEVLKILDRKFEREHELDGVWTNVLITGWTDFDEGMLAMILTFWFIGRVWESSKK
ncbi:MAG: hypothetical protein EBR30_24285 [Cytophagia bacterium]|nr:hypothetical protein [Cytophagia bacterium]